MLEVFFSQKIKGRKFSGRRAVDHLSSLSLRELTMMGDEMALMRTKGWFSILVALPTLAPSGGSCS